MTTSSMQPASIHLGDGTRIALDIHDMQPPWRNALPVVLVHGFSKHRRFWYDWLQPLARHRKLINLDQRGHGASSPVKADFRMQLDVFADDLAGVLDALELPRAHFVMAEFSSSVALVLARRHPERIASLVLPGFGYNWRAGAVSPTAWAELIEREGTAAWARSTVSARLPADADPRLRDWYVQEQSRMPASFMSGLFRFSANLDLTDHLDAVTMPTLLMGGTLALQDTADSLRRAHQRMPSSELVLIEGMPFNVMSACPERCVAATCDFLERQP